MKKTLLHLTRFLISTLTLIAILIYTTQYVTGIKLTKLNLQISNIDPRAWQIQDLNMHTEYGDILVHNAIYSDQKEIIEELTFIPNKIPFHVKFENITVDFKHQIIIATWQNHSIKAQKIGTNHWSIQIDKQAYYMKKSDENIILTSQDNQIIILYQTQNHKQDAYIDLSFLHGIHGKIFWHSNNKAHEIYSMGIQSPWCSVKNSSIKYIALNDNWSIKINQLKCLDLLELSAQGIYSDSATSIHVTSNLGDLHSYKTQGHWKESLASTWRINNNCIEHQSKHKICIQPNTTDYLEISGPFSLSTRPWVGILAHISLDGQYMVKINRSKDPINIKLIDLKGDLDHLAKLFLMRVSYIIDDGQIEMLGSLDKLHGSGKLFSKQGNVDLETTWDAGKSGLDLFIRSNNIHISDNHNFLNSKINLNLFLSALTQLSGNINISNGNLEIKPMMNVQTLHEDVYIVGETEKPKFAVDLNIETDKPVKINGMGLTGDLSGWLNIHADNNIEQAISGILHINPAVFRLYGREIILDDVQISWLKHTWDSAHIDILAHRKINTSITRPLQVDLSIQGPIDSPDVHLSSNQANVTQLQMLSMLFSRSTTTNHKEDADIIESLKNNPGQRSLLQLLAMVDRLERRLGLDLFEISGMGESINSNIPHHVTFGKLLHPKVMLKYSMSLNSNESNHLTLDYNVMPHLNLELDTDRENAGIYLLYEK